jgi:hypothetical protein
MRAENKIRCPQVLSLSTLISNIYKLQIQQVSSEKLLNINNNKQQEVTKKLDQFLQVASYQTFLTTIIIQKWIFKVTMLHLIKTSKSIQHFLRGHKLPFKQNLTKIVKLPLIWWQWHSKLNQTKWLNWKVYQSMLLRSPIEDQLKKQTINKKSKQQT